MSGEYREGEEEFFDKALLTSARVIWSSTKLPPGATAESVTEAALEAAMSLTLARRRGLERLRHPEPKKP